jgi:hypothetical protein
MSFDPIATIQAARAQQLRQMMQMRSNNFPYSTGGNGQLPTYGGSYGRDTVTLGGNTWGAGAPGDTRLSNGQTIEEIFENPYGGENSDMSYLKDALDRIAEARRLYGAQPSQKEGQKGDLRVIAGDRADGVKPKEVRIDDANNYDWQEAENSYQDNRQETRFKDGTVGREYDVTVTWEDGTTTKKRVTMEEPGQIVYIRSADGY